MIHLRKLEPADLPFLYLWENDAAVWSEGDTHNPLSKQDLRDYIASTTGDIYHDGQLRLIIEQSEDNAPDSRYVVGCIDLFDFDPRNRKAALGMYIAPNFRGKGLGKQALHELENYAFSILDMRLLYALISVRNIPCSHLYERAAYTRIAVLPAWTLENDVAIWLKHR